MPVGREYWRARALTAEPWRNAENSRVRAPSFFRVQPTNANGVVVSDTQDLHLHDVARDDETHQLVRARARRSKKRGALVCFTLRARSKSCRVLIC